MSCVPGCSLHVDHEGACEYFGRPLPGLPPARAHVHATPTLLPDRAVRHNEGKPQLFYADMFPAALEGIAKAYMYGTNRRVKPYPRFNWAKGAPFLELYDCARRHMVKWLNGEDADPDAAENGFPDLLHLDLAIGNLVRLRQQIADGRKDLDDRGYRVKGP